jgi:hypothetical protein
MKRGVGALLLIIGIGFFLAGFDSITGNVIGVKNPENYFSVVGAIFLLSGIVLFSVKNISGRIN